jgi:transcriptional regulator with XRE-family HTH domain
MSTILSAPDIEATLAKNLHEQRESRGWTLAELAARSGVSRAMLSKIERREASPTAALLGRLTAALGMTLSRLFEQMEDQPAGQIMRAAEQPLWRDPETGFTRRALTPPQTWALPATPLEMVWGELPPGAEIAYPGIFPFIADQQLVVISGQLAIRQAGVGYLLEAGDCLRFGSPTDVLFRNPGAARCRYVIAILRAPGPVQERR